MQVFIKKIIEYKIDMYNIINSNIRSEILV